MSDLRLDVKLGAGCFGEVWSGVDPVHGAVAVKCLKRLVGSETEEQWEARKVQTVAEGRRLAAASHPNVVKVFHVSLLPNVPDTIGLVMELCAGGSLEKPYLAGPLTLERVRRIATDATCGLQAMHRKQMLHRDIKPANILLDSQGAAKLGDFGMVTSDLAFGYGSLASNAYADHAAYETLYGQNTSERTDIWALGMTIYRLLHGCDWYGLVPPARGNVALGDYRDYLVWLPHVPRAWRTFVRRCLHDDPALRFQNATEVLNALAMLPTQADWECQVARGRITWRRTHGDRLHDVQWNISEHNGQLRTQSWQALSRPLGPKGNTVRLGSGTTDPELRKFFAQQR